MRAIGETAAWFFRILWACRIGFLSGGGGILLFTLGVPAQNLLEDLSFFGSIFSEFAFWALVYTAVVVVWALPICFGARIVLDDDGWIFSSAQLRAVGKPQAAEIERTLRKQLRPFIIAIPPLLGLAPFVAIALGIATGIETDKGATGLLEYEQTTRQAHWLLVADAVAAVVYLLVAIARISRTERDRPTDLGRTLDIPWVSAIVTAVIFVLAYVAPIFISIWFPRALLVPLLFGSLVLGLCLLQRASHRVGFPLTLVVIAAAMSITAANATFHALRTLPRVESRDGRLGLAEAVGQWRKANGCPATGPCDRRPLIVAIDGGASRAAFTAATFVGALLDRMEKRDGEAATPGRRIFAISGVSGGAIGATMIQAALADAQGTQGPPERSPCRTADRSWFGYAYRPRTEQNFRWQECLQALTSGDFLSPTIVGLAFRDFIAPDGLIQDRAVLLEQSFERHYDYTVSDAPSLLGSGHVCDAASASGLCRRLGHARDFLDKHPDGWIPMLLLNGTSVRTGRRIITSDLAAARVTGKEAPLFAEAFDLVEILSSPCPKAPERLTLGIQPAQSLNQSASANAQTVRTNQHGVCGNAQPLDGNAIRLSTAALSSARFPLISPAGAFEMKSAPFGDQVVDGGYFENSGITTALEVVDALQAAGLDPLLLSIANEPAESDLDQVQKARTGAPPRAGLPRRPSTTPLTVFPNNGFFARMFGTLSAPFETLISTRDGHASEAEGRAEAKLGARNFFRMHVDQKPVLQPVESPAEYDRAYCHAIWERQEPPLSMAKVSMSWWLSALVQADLDAQKCSRSNQEKMTRLLKALGNS